MLYGHRFSSPVADRCNLVVSFLATGSDSIDDAVGQVVVAEFEGDGLKCTGCRRDLVKDVAAVCVLFDLPLKTTDLTFDPSKPL